MSLVELEPARNGVFILSLNRPEKRNAMNAELLEELGIQLGTAFAAPACRAIVITGRGGTFTVGGDVDTIGAQSMLDTRARLLRNQQVVRQLATGPKPVIAAVESLCFGFGMSIVAMADHAVARAGTKFGSAFSKIGLIPDGGLMWSLPLKVGFREAKRMITFGETIDASKALDIGLVDEVVETDVLERSIAAAERFSALAPASIAFTRSAFARVWEGLETSLAIELDMQPVLLQTADFQEGVAAIREKRLPSFNGN